MPPAPGRHLEGPAMNDGSYARVLASAFSMPGYRPVGPLEARYLRVVLYRLLHSAHALDGSGASGAFFAHGASLQRVAKGYEKQAGFWVLAPAVRRIIRLAPQISL